MAISADYTTSVLVNGYQCRNCTDVDRAKRNIDPASPSAGPIGLTARSKDQPGGRFAHVSAAGRDPQELARRHAASIALAGPIAAAYGAGAAAAPGEIVRLSA